MSTRTFLRRFKDATGMPPGEWLLGERLIRARELLETTRNSIEDIAGATGFGSAATLRHHFRLAPRHQSGSVSKPLRAGGKEPRE